MDGVDRVRGVPSYGPQPRPAPHPVDPNASHRNAPRDDEREESFPEEEAPVEPEESREEPPSGHIDLRV